ncbi:hypothetical protein [Helcococcus sueciensis]|uniref:hypothetical protein n=1 Tax=Helcococcus sueciensis TaxID=241555 RepID=UPI0004041185|nr:hypothetical protein [Helcococcus sueciensis]
MTVEEVKVWLNRAYRIDEEIEREKKEYIRLDDVKNSVGGSNLDKPNVQTSAPKSANFEDRVIRLDEIQQSIKDRIVEKEEVKEEIAKSIDMLDDHFQRKVIILRHFNYYKWNKIEKYMHYSEKQCRRIYQKAIENLVKIIDEKEKRLKDVR